MNTSFEIGYIFTDNIFNLMDRYGNYPFYWRCYVCREGIKVVTPGAVSLGTSFKVPI